MSKPNELTLDELVDNILSVKGYRVSRKTDVWSELLDRTSALPEKSVPTERALYVKFDKSGPVHCEFCGNPAKINARIKDEFVTVCSDTVCRGQKTVRFLNAIDPETETTNRERVVLKQKQTKAEIDLETGLTRAQIIGLKGKQTKAIINPETGLTISQESGLKQKQTLSKINPETGLSRGQERGLKSKLTLSKIDPETGMSGHKSKGLKSKQTKLKINPETGLTGYKKTAEKIHATLSRIDPETGLSGHQKAGAKTKQTKSEIDPETGLSIYDTIGKKTKHARSQIDPETGLSGYHESAIKTHATLAEIDPETGLSGHQKAAAKSHAKLAEIDPETGLSGHQKAGLKTAKKRRSKTYKKIVDSNPEFTILTTQDEYISHLGSVEIKYECNECNTIRTSAFQYIRCLECNPYFISIPEKEVFEFCNQFTDDLEFSNRALIYPKEVDIYSEKFKLAIEFDGVYWHSSDSVINEKRDYHLEKTQLCEQQGVQLLHVFENEWIDEQKQTIWKSIIRNKFGKSNRIFARKCVIKPVDSKTTKMFLENNHLQGSCPSSINYGLYYNDELVSLMTFGKSRYNKNYEYELLRFCNTVDTSVVGGVSRLFKHFIKNHKGSVISYADKRRSNGNLYQQLGFELSHETNPNYFYVDNIDPLMLHSRVKFQKHKLPEILDVFDKSKTESENMYANGYRKIFDCGNYVFTYLC